jgi:Ser/Thr protein kinase RdoA (MazF antagonist)
MWQPDPSWTRLPAGPSSHGVWLATEGGRDVVVKRLLAPAAHDPGMLSDPRSVSWWRREVDVALSDDLVATPGLRAPAPVAVTEDEEGITLRVPLVADARSPGLLLAHCLGRFAGTELPDRPWHARGLLRQRVRMVERRGGWTTLARTTVADVAALLWSRRDAVLDALDALPQVPQHGDAVPANLRGRDGDDVVAVDWSTFGRGPVGADLGYLSLSTREDFEPLVSAYLSGLPDGVASRGQVLLGARAMAVYTVLTRADWALGQVADGEGALAGKYRHPAVAPYLRAMQRQLPQIEAMLGEGTLR